MKGRVLVLDQIDGRQAAALLVDGRLEELAIDPKDDVAIPGAIYRAVADRPVKGQGGIFVKLPEGSGFLRQISGVAPGQRLLVQVTGPTEPGKAVPVSIRLLFKSRFAIITPDAPGLNISRKIKDEDRRAELSAMAEAGMAGADDRLGLILRSGCLEAEDTAIAEDIAAMRGLAEAVLADSSGPPELLVDGPSAHDLAFRDWLDPAVDDADTDPDSFDRHGVIEALEALRTPQVMLEAGAHMMIEPTRALVSVDVNTGPDTSPAASLKANIATARDLPRQLRLRGLGGQVVVDFAPMPKRDRHILDQVLKAAFKTEGETNLAGWTTLGLYELTRKRDRLPLADLLPRDLP
ncbi:MAG: ribonuclease E/G [Tabrizicola sp.]|mgnify:CR=1 FL=1|jgi:Ribonuclease G/E|uniref:ribonuclease E/G n=1 Tax=Tabrizicola sp. TaxID=2005166 RepID=UPI001B442826|nr:ribonuclease E/G [Tabrizicola sp.]